jgi:hypothetical protein
LKRPIVPAIVALNDAPMNHLVCPAGSNNTDGGLLPIRFAEGGGGDGADTSPIHDCTVSTGTIELTFAINMVLPVTIDVWLMMGCTSNGSDSVNTDVSVLKLISRAFKSDVVGVFHSISNGSTSVPVPVEHDKTWF